MSLLHEPCDRTTWTVVRTRAAPKAARCAREPALPSGRCCQEHTPHFGSPRIALKANPP